MPAKLCVGMFSFSSCEGCFANILTLIDREHEGILKAIELKSARLVQKRSEIEGLDIAFVEGSICTPKDAEKLKEIRENSKKLILLGTCAVDGWPSTQRNNFLPEQKAEIALSVRKLGQLNEITPPEKLVKVDAKVVGCPISNEQFKQCLKEQFKEFGISYA